MADIAGSDARPSERLTAEAFLAFIDAHPEVAWELVDGVPAPTFGPDWAWPYDRDGRVWRSMMLQPDAAYDGLFEPDVMVGCADAPAGDDRAVTDAVAVFDVLSPSTMHRDRGVKMAAYQASPSLRFIALVYQTEMRVEVGARAAGAPWPETPPVRTALEHSLSVPPADAEIMLATLYDGVELA